MINLLVKMFGMEMVAFDNECPFEPNVINDRPVLAILNGKAILGQKGIKIMYFAIHSYNEHSHYVNYIVNGYVNAWDAFNSAVRCADYLDEHITIDLVDCKTGEVIASNDDDLLA